MSEPLSIYALIANASLLVQIIMVLLAAVSIASWVMIFQRWRALDRVQLELNEFEDYFWSGIDLRELHKDLGKDSTLTGIETVFVSGFTEFQRLSEQPNTDTDSIMQGVQRVMRVEVSREEEQLEKHLGFLATVGSTSPYVGLF
ncbi:MAG: MotA/TolQ/ExbB proton channel family protein, partial [Pseudomonadota bacterium]|nr:MotA/TolQ/ExbB proton channel family protein [Pseudomonadota bacterium]MEC9286615.1 MotA/TolQ/ExbB proton channel family protein [Pseudomonadota bacterium]